jgi:hypothetical protein
MHKEHHFRCLRGTGTQQKAYKGMQKEGSDRRLFGCSDHCGGHHYGLERDPVSQQIIFVFFSFILKNAIHLKSNNPPIKKGGLGLLFFIKNWWGIWQIQ